MGTSIRISGPVSVYKFDLDDAKRIILFGDEHFSYDGLCSPCRRPSCYDIAAYIRELANDASAKDLDVFLEMPYVTKRGNPDRERVLRFWDDLMKSDTGPRRGPVESIRTFLTGPSPAYVGVISALYDEFAKELYDDDAKKKAKKKGGPRFHYADARQEPNVSRLFPVDAVMSRVGDSSAVAKLLRAFIFAKDFGSEVSRALGNDAAREVSREALSSEGAHKIATQFLRLPDNALKESLKSYLSERIDDVERLMKLDVGLDSKQHVLHSPALDGGREPWLSKLRRANRDLFLAKFSMATRLAVRVLLMDAYLICRLARFAQQQRAGGTTIVYVGDGHAQYYVDFLQRFLQLKPSLVHNAASGDWIKRRSARRCVTLPL